MNVGTYVHIVEPIVDSRKSAFVGNVFIDLDFAVQIIWTNGLRGPQEKTQKCLD